MRVAKSSHQIEPRRASVGKQERDRERDLCGMRTLLPAIRLGARRAIFCALVTLTILLAIAAFVIAFLKNGLTAIEIGMAALFALNLPWIAIGLWNAVIGWILLSWTNGDLSRVVPLARLNEPPLPPEGRVAIIMPIHDEEPDAVLAILKATLASLDRTGRSAPFDVFVLSDSRDHAIAAREQVLFAAWRSADARPERLHYRRRAENVGFKAGNIRDFCDRWGNSYDFMIVLDADSVMSGTAILRLVGLMQANPRLGILQTLIVGLPSTSAFARIFQFGMRHGMRAYAMGSAWWQGDSGPYWGHNAIIRLRPFIEHCHLPLVPGPPPLGGVILSHDQIEAVLMRRAGWDVRVLPIEDGSFEANPPTLLEFSKRDLRWCQGNMQYTRLLQLAGSCRIGRLQMLLAILMYTAAPCWLLFCLLALAQPLIDATGLPPLEVFSEPAWLPGEEALTAIRPGLLLGVIGMTWAPKLFGLLHALGNPAMRRSYGGGRRLLLGGAVELLFSALLTPVVITCQTVFMGGLLLGRRLKWRAQRRADRSIAAREALRRLWPQALLGLAFLAGFVVLLPGATGWASPMIAGLLLAVPFAAITASPRFGSFLCRARLGASPEELRPTPEVRAVCPWLAAASPSPSSDGGGKLPDRAATQPEATAAS
jgi:membrane glycosyltransferase